MRIAEAFNCSGLSRFINSSAGRIFRLVVGTGFLVVGYLFRITHSLHFRLSNHPEEPLQKCYFITIRRIPYRHINQIRACQNALAV